MDDVVLRGEGLGKRYGGVLALAEGNLAMRAGEIHALVGENGAGKSTLVKILSGIVPPDAGRLEVAGEEAAFPGARAAQRAGIALVAQELSLFPDLTVRENMFPGALPLRRGLISNAAIDERARPVLRRLGLDVDMREVVGRLSLADQQLIEIARAVLQEPRVLILDEPTSAQPRAAVARLERVLRELAASGLAILYISHFLEEVLRMADRVTVMRDGRTVVEGRRRAEVDLDSLVTSMIGHSGTVPRLEAGAREGAGASTGSLVVDRVTVAGELEDVSLTVAPGEIVGVTGLQGAGHLALFAAVCGRATRSAGTVTAPSGVVVHGLRGAMAAGIAFVPGDRKKLGLTLDQTLWQNVASRRWLGLGRGGPFERRGHLRSRARHHLAALRVKGHVDAPAGALSGGNQQKVVFAACLEAGPDVLVLDDPTRGVDIGARAEMHNVIRGFAGSGGQVLLASSDLAELVEVCDRVIVFQRGRVVRELTGEELTAPALSTAMNLGFTVHV